MTETKIELDLTKVRDNGVKSFIEECEKNEANPLSVVTQLISRIAVENSDAELTYRGFNIFTIESRFEIDIKTNLAQAVSSLCSGFSLEHLEKVYRKLTLSLHPDLFNYSDQPVGVIVGALMDKVEREVSIND